MDFGNKLQKLRKENSLTQEQLAEKLFVSRSAISKWESGRGYPSIDSLQLIAKIFLLTIDVLLSNDEILTIAKSNSKINIKKIELSIFGFIDIIFLLFIFIPLFSQKNDTQIISVSLLKLTDIPAWIKISYFVLISFIAIWGIVEEVIQYFNLEKIFVLSQIISLGLHSALTLLFIANMQPYGVTLSLCLLLMKVVILLKSSIKKN